MRNRGDDIELLFRKFASDFAEKYRVKPITLDPEAKEILLKYSFPGNIRQLKNIVEQISVLSTEQKLITATVLLNYLPPEKSKLPILYHSDQENGEKISERDLLYKVLFDMKRDVTELKKLVLGMLSDKGQESKVLEQHQSLFEDIENGKNNLSKEVKAEPEHTESTYLINIESGSQPSSYHTTDEENNIQDITHEAQVEEEESLSIEKKEKELIIRALEKNNNKRKYAAHDLGISERTLYRKIKQYQLEDL